MGAVRLERAVGVLIIGAATLAAALLWIAIAIDPPRGAEETRSGVLLGAWEVLYDTEAPSLRIMLAAVAVALLLAAGVALLEKRIADRARRSDDPRGLPLAPKVVMAETRGRFDGPVTVTVLIPAHDEAASIGATIDSLMTQSHRPDRVLVVADNCTDDTAAIARRHGAEVVESVGNVHKKAGALNQALRDLLPGLGDNDTVMVMDADTRLDDGFLEAAVRRFTADRALMAVGGLFYGDEGHGMLGQFQRNEYARYSRDLRRRRGRVFVLTGTASIFRSRAMRTIADSRGREIPGHHGDVYDTAALTEDNEITIALKSLGGLMISPQECTVVTEIMPSWRHLWNQRLRWQRGAVENLGAYGIRPQTFRYWAQQLGIGYGVIALTGYAALIVLMALSLDQWVWFPFWIGLGLVFVVERIVSVWSGGWRARVLAATLFPELFYAAFLNVVFVRGVLDISLGRRASWNHVQHAPRAEALETA